MSSSAASSSAGAQQKFSNIRRRLDQLGYRQPLGIESLPLVEKLLTDLVHTTESLKRARLGRSIGDGSAASGDAGSHALTDAQIDAYKSDNARLIRENNELHQQLMHSKEELEFSIKDLKGSLRKLEHENADLRFLNNQYIHKMRSLELDSKQKTERILQLQEKNFHAVVQTPGGKKKNIPFRRQRMEIDAMVPPSDLSKVPQFSEDPYVADLLKVADENIARLREEALVLSEEKVGLEGKISNLQRQVDSRQSEIDRLTTLLDGGRPYDVVALEARNRGNERLISHLNIQIDYLQQKNAELQRQLDGTVTSSKSRLNDKRNVELAKELQDVDALAHQLQKEKDHILSAADRDVAFAKAEVEKGRNQLRVLESELSKLNAERENYAVELDELKKQLSLERKSREHFDELIDKLQHDKKRLTARISKLTATEKDLVLEIDRLRHHQKRGTAPDSAASGNVKKPKDSSGAVDSFIKGIEDECNYWKSQAEELQLLLRAKISDTLDSSSPSVGLGRSRSRSSSPNRRAAASPARESRSPARQKTVSRGTSPAANYKKLSGQYDALVQSLEEERDRYKQECELLKSTRSRPTSPSRLGAARDKSSDVDAELAQVGKERDELQKVLDKFERHMSEIQANVRVLTQERDNLTAAYNETKDELTRLRREVVRSPKSVKSSLAAQAVLRRVENERDDALANLRNLNVERDTLHERLKIATDAQLADRARFEQTIEDLQNALRAVEVEREAVGERLKRSVAFDATLEERLRQQEVELAEARDRESQYRATATQMKLLADQAERAMKDQQSLLNNKDADVRAMNEHVNMLEEQVAALKRAGQVDRDELAKLRATVAALDREKDLLQAAVDEKTEIGVKQQETVVVRERMLSEMRSSITDLQTVNERLKETIAAKDREIVSLRRQLDAGNDELTDVGRSREVALRENRRLQDDLALMTRENQSLHAELNEAVMEKEALKKQMQDYVIEIKRCQELLSSKERERIDILEQYRSLSQSAERFETQAHHLESESSNMKLELLTRDSEVRRLREKVDSLERQIEEHITAEHTFEVQLSNANRSVANLEELVRTGEQEKHQLLLDLAAARDLCSRIESAKDGLQRQLVAKALDQEKLQALLDDVRRETEALRAQLANERSTKQGLEGLLQDNHTKGWKTQLTIQERETENQLLRDRLALNESKIESQSRELNQQRMKTIEIESEVERLKRQLISEKFERERCVQELRRNGLAPPGELPNSRLGSISPSRPRSRSPTRQTPASVTSLPGGRPTPPLISPIDSHNDSSSASPVHHSPQLISPIENRVSLSDQ